MTRRADSLTLTLSPPPPPPRPRRRPLRSADTDPAIGMNILSSGSPGFRSVKPGNLQPRADTARARTWLREQRTIHHSSTLPSPRPCVNRRGRRGRVRDVSSRRALHAPPRAQTPPGVEARVMRRRRFSPSRQRSEDRVASRSLGRATAEFGAHRLAKTRVNDPRLHPRQSLARPIFLILRFLLLLILVCRPRPRRRESLIGERGPESLRGRGGPLAGQRQRAHRRRRARGQLAHPRAPQLVGGELGAVLGGGGGGAGRREVRIRLATPAPGRGFSATIRGEGSRSICDALRARARARARVGVAAGLSARSGASPVGGWAMSPARGARRAGVSGELPRGRRGPRLP